MRDRELFFIQMVGFDSSRKSRAWIVFMERLDKFIGYLDIMIGQIEVMIRQGNARKMTIVNKMAASDQTASYHSCLHLGR